MRPHRVTEPPVAMFAKALATHRGAIYRYLLRRVGNPAEAEELTQETLLRAHRHIDSLKAPAALKTWLYRIAAHVFYDHLRRASRRSTLVPLDALPADALTSRSDGHIDRTSAPDKRLEQGEMSRCVQGLLTELSLELRTVLALHDEFGLTTPEIAERLGCSVPTVKIRLHRARRKLAESIEKACHVRQDERGVVVCDPASG